MENQRYIFNASFYTTPSHRKQWEEWLNRELLPFVSEILPQVKSEVFEVLSSVNNDMLVFSVQFRCATPTELEVIQQKTTAVFEDFKKQFGERVTNFNSILNKIA